MPVAPNNPTSQNLNPISLLWVCHTFLHPTALYAFIQMFHNTLHIPSSDRPRLSIHVSSCFFFSWQECIPQYHFPTISTSYCSARNPFTFMQSLEAEEFMNYLQIVLIRVQKQKKIRILVFAASVKVKTNLFSVTRTFTWTTDTNTTTCVSVSRQGGKLEFADVDVRRAVAAAAAAVSVPAEENKVIKWVLQH